jgi:hypothetical protein
VAALVICEARRRPEYAERLACTACLILDQLGEEERGLRVSAKVTLAEALRRKLDLEEADAALLSAQEDLCGSDSPWERAEVCLGLAQLRWEQRRLEEAFALAERASRLYSDLNARREATAASLELAGWYVSLGETREAGVSFVLALSCAPDGELLMQATRGLVQQVVRLNRPDLALELVQEVHRPGRWPRSSLPCCRPCGARSFRASWKRSPEAAVRGRSSWQRWRSISIFRRNPRNRVERRSP